MDSQYVVAAWRHYEGTDAAEMVIYTQEHLRPLVAVYEAARRFLDTWDASDSGGDIDTCDAADELRAALVAAPGGDE